MLRVENAAHSGLDEDLRAALGVGLEEPNVQQAMVRSHKILEHIAQHGILSPHDQQRLKIRMYGSHEHAIVKSPPRWIYVNGLVVGPRRANRRNAWQAIFEPGQGSLPAVMERATDFRGRRPPFDSRELARETEERANASVIAMVDMEKLSDGDRRRAAALENTDGFLRGSIPLVAITEFLVPRALKALVQDAFPSKTVTAVPNRTTPFGVVRLEDSRVRWITISAPNYVTLLAERLDALPSGNRLVIHGIRLVAPSDVTAALMPPTPRTGPSTRPSASPKTGLEEPRPATEMAGKPAGESRQPVPAVPGTGAAAPSPARRAGLEESEEVGVQLERAVVELGNELGQAGKPLGRGMPSARGVRAVERDAPPAPRHTPTPGQTPPPGTPSTDQSPSEPPSLAIQRQRHADQPDVQRQPDPEGGEAKRLTHDAPQHQPAQNRVTGVEDHLQQGVVLFGRERSDQHVPTYQFTTPADLNEGLAPARPAGLEEPAAETILVRADDHQRISRQQATGPLEQIRSQDRRRNVAGERGRVNQQLYQDLLAVVEAVAGQVSEAQREKALNHLEELTAVGDRETLNRLDVLLRRADFGRRLRGAVAKALYRLEGYAVRATRGRVVRVDLTDAKLNASLQELARALEINASHVELADVSQKDQVTLIDFAEYSLIENRYIVYRAEQRGGDVHVYRKDALVADGSREGERLYRRSRIRLLDVRGNTSERVSMEEFERAHHREVPPTNRGIFAHTHVTFDIVPASPGQQSARFMGHIFELEGTLSLQLVELKGIRLLRLFDEVRPSEFDERTSEYPTAYPFRGFDPIKIIPDAAGGVARPINAADHRFLVEHGVGYREISVDAVASKIPRVSGIGAFVGGLGISTYREYLLIGRVAMRNQQATALKLRVDAGDEEGLMARRFMGLAPQSDIANMALGEWFIFAPDGTTIHFVRLDDYDGKQNMIRALTAPPPARRAGLEEPRPAGEPAHPVPAGPGTSSTLARRAFLAAIPLSIAGSYFLIRKALRPEPPKRDWNAARVDMTTRMSDLNQQLTQQFLAVYPEERALVEDMNRGGEIVFANYASEVHAYFINSPSSDWESQRVAETLRANPTLLLTGRRPPRAETVQHVNTILRHPGIAGLFNKIIQSANVRQPSAGLNDFDHHAVDYLALRSGIKAIDLIEDGRHAGQGVAHRLPYYAVPRSAISRSEDAFMDLASGTNFEDYLPDILESASQRPIILVDISPYVSRFWNTLSQALGLHNIEVMALDVRQLSRASIARRVGTVRLQNVAPWVRDLSEEWVGRLFDLIEPGGQIVLVQPTGQLLADNPGRPKQVDVGAFVQSVMKRDEHNAKLIRNFALVLGKRGEEWEFLYGHVGKSGRLYETQGGYAKFREGALPEIYDSLIIFQKRSRPVAAPPPARDAGLEEGAEDLPHPTGFELDPRRNREAIVAGNIEYLRSRGLWSEALRSVGDPCFLLEDDKLPAFLDKVFLRRALDTTFLKLFPAIVTGMHMAADSKEAILAAAKAEAHQHIKDNILPLAYLLQSLYWYAHGLNEQSRHAFEQARQSAWGVGPLGLFGDVTASDRYFRLAETVYFDIDPLKARFLFQLGLRQFDGASDNRYHPADIAPHIALLRKSLDGATSLEALGEFLAIRNAAFSGWARRRASAGDARGQALQAHYASTKQETLAASATVTHAGTAVVLGAGSFVVLPLAELLRERLPDGQWKYRRIVLIELGEGLSQRALQQLIERGGITTEEATRIEVVNADVTLLLKGITAEIDAVMDQARRSHDARRFPSEAIGQLFEKLTDPEHLARYILPVEERPLKTGEWNFVVFAMALQDFTASIKDYVGMWATAFRKDTVTPALRHWHSETMARNVATVIFDDLARVLAQNGVVFFGDVIGIRDPEGATGSAEDFYGAPGLLALVPGSLPFEAVRQTQWPRPINREDSTSHFVVQGLTLRKTTPPPTRHAGLEEPRPAGETIPVLVEADRDHVEFIREALGPGFRVTDDPGVFTDGAGPRVVIVDSPAPELTQQIRHRWPSAKLVAITGGTADAVVSTPLDWEELKQAVYAQLGMAVPELLIETHATSDDLAAGREERGQLGRGA